jgi:long-chain fatty acid transport protein
VGGAPLARGSGFLIYEHGAAAQAMGGAFVAIANNPSAIFHNPAGIAFLKGTQVSVGGTFIFPKGSVTLTKWPYPPYNGATVKMKDKTFFPPNFYLTHRFNDKLAAGIGVFAPYGLGTNWPDPKNFPLRYIGTSNDMQTIFVNPTVAYKISEKFSIGAGVSYIHSTLSLELTRSVSIEHPLYGLLWAGDVYAKVDGAKGDAVGFNAGLLYKEKSFSLGFNWRSGFKIKYKGNLTLDTVNVPAPYKAFVPTEGEVSTTFNFPNILGVGAAFNLTEKIMLSADLQYFTWSTYKNYVIDINYTGVPGTESETVDEDWKDSIILRGGMQYQLNDSLALRLGILWDQTPQPAKSADPNLPDASRVALTGGLGYKIGQFVIDATFHYEMFSDRTSPNRYPYPGYNPIEGTYKMTASLIGISLTYLF